MATDINTLVTELRIDPTARGYATIIAGAEQEASRAGRYLVSLGGFAEDGKALATRDATDAEKAAAIRDVRAQLVRNRLCEIRETPEPVRRPTLTLKAITSCYVASEVAGKLSALRGELEAIAHDGEVDVSTPAGWAILAPIFGACPETLKAIDAAAMYAEPSRAQEVLGFSAHVSLEDVDAALTLLGT